MEYRVIWPDGHTEEVEAERVKYARWRAVTARQFADGYMTSDDERRTLDVQAVRNTEHDACLVAQAKDGGWWLIANPEIGATEPRTTTLPCPRCEKPLVITEDAPENLPGRPFVMWEFKDRDDAEALCTMVNVTILVAALRAAADEPEVEAAATPDVDGAG